MSEHKKFGVWMDTIHATIVGNNDGELFIVGHVKGEKATHNSSEKNEHNDERTLQTKYFKEIAKHIQNATHLHASGTGQVQEQFIKYLADTPQFKNVQTEDSTANKMSDENLLKYFGEKIN
jgi:stalled ribosome rescue protein Dom34